MGTYSHRPKCVYVARGQYLCNLSLINRRVRSCKWTFTWMTGSISPHNHSPCSSYSSPARRQACRPPTFVFRVDTRYIYVTRTSPYLITRTKHAGLYAVGSNTYPTYAFKNQAIISDAFVHKWERNGTLQWGYFRTCSNFCVTLVLAEKNSFKNCCE
jgi:hypothetical protein